MNTNNKNNAILLGWYGGDEAIACSEWTSTSRELTEEKRARIPALLKLLWSAEPVPHGSPFEKGVVHFLVNCDIASHIHLLKHRIASINAESARYKELKEDMFYLPEDWRGKRISKEIYFDDDGGVYKPEWCDWATLLADYTELGNKLYHQCLEDLTPILGRKRAKESARYFKTYNSQIQADVMFNMRSFHNFITQRMDDHAQLEIQDIARQMLELVKNIEGNPFQHTLNAFGFTK
jgi:flavin-dependent thymidylate synthase